MNRRTPFALLGSWLALALAPGSNLAAADETGRASAPGSATLTGRVQNDANGQYLTNARLTVRGTRMVAFTDDTGTYRFDHLPPGRYIIEVFYTGLDPQQLEFEVAAGQNVTKHLRLGAAIMLDSFVVSTSKEMDGAAIAINEQRFAPNIVNIVSADEFGTIADGSVGEFMKFLPGVTTDYTGGDARRFSIGGVSPGNMPITFGGFDLASASGATTSRAVELDQVSINSIARIEVLHSPTPESVGTALAGSVNFVPRTAFERSRPVFNFSASLQLRDSEKNLWRKTPGPWFGESTDKARPGFDFSAIVPVSKDFGFTLSGGYSLQYMPLDYASLTWRGVSAATSAPTANGTPGSLPDTTPDKPYLTNFALLHGGKDTEQYSLATTIDRRLGPRDRLSFSFQYAFLTHSFASRYLTFNLTRVLPGNFGPTFTHGAAGGGEVTITTGARIRPGRTIMPTLIWRHDGPVWNGEAGASYSNSRIQYLDVDKGSFNGATARRSGVTVAFDDIFYLRPGSVSVTDANGAPVNPYLLDSYALSSAASVRTKVYDERRTAYANLRRDLTVQGVPVTLKGGVDVRTAVRDMTGSGTEGYNFVGRDGRASTSPVGSDDGAGILLDEVFSRRVPNFGFPPTQYIDAKKYWQLYRTHPEYFSLPLNAWHQNAVNSSKRAEEVVSSAFLRGDVSLLQRRLKFVGGLRAEQVNIDAAGPLVDPTGNYRKDATGNIQRGADGRPVLILPTTDALGVARLTYLERGYHAEKEYLRLFPNLNVSYEIRPNLIGRVSYYHSVGRPDFNQYSGGLSLPDMDRPPSAGNRITVSNVGIKAWTARSTRMRFEYYLPGVGQVSIGGFIRSFENFFGTTVLPATPGFLAAYGLDPEVLGPYDVSTQYNLSETVRMHGLEFDYKQALSFLPVWARGVQAFFNASSQRATGADYFPDMIPFNANWGVSLTRPAYNLRVNWNYRGLQRRGPVAAGRGIEPGTYNYRSKRLYIDVSGEYFLTRKLALYFVLRNVGNATEDTKVYGPNTPDYAKFWRREEFASLWNFGVKGSF